MESAHSAMLQKDTFLSFPPCPLRSELLPRVCRGQEQAVLAIASYSKFCSPGFAGLTQAKLVSGPELWVKLTQ